MLTAEGCRQRRQRLWDALDPKPGVEFLALADTAHLRYFANFFVDPISQSAEFGGVLLVRRDGSATVVYDHRLPKSVEQAHVDERKAVPWYDGQSPGRGPRQLAILDTLKSLGVNRIHDHPLDPLGPTIIRTVADLRRSKDPDELAVLRQCMLAGDAGQAWARENVRPGMTELDVYNGISAAVNRDVGRATILYGDFAVSPGPERRGGPATERVINPGDMLILDFSVVIFGYRSDFTNTLVVGAEPTGEQRALYDLCTKAMAAGEERLKAGVACQGVYDAVRAVFAAAGVADSFPHHAGHGLGLTHPEAPYFVRHADETLRAGDVVTLEPGLYVEGVGGLRIENNYSVTAAGCERLSNHVIALR
jgi:Xaa-Pro dipeptidase